MTTVGSLALGDLNGDARDDIIAGQGEGGSRVAVVDGIDRQPPQRLHAYGPEVKGGVNVADRHPGAGAG